MTMQSHTPISSHTHTLQFESVQSAVVLRSCVCVCETVHVMTLMFLNKVKKLCLLLPVRLQRRSISWLWMKTWMTSREPSTCSGVFYNQTNNVLWGAEVRSDEFRAHRVLNLTFFFVQKPEDKGPEMEKQLWPNKLSQLNIVANSSLIPEGLN